MRIVRLGSGTFVSLLLFASATLAAGSSARTFVSATGADTNPCSLTSPCRTFSAAIAQTVSGGEVVALSSAGYGPFTISQAVTITAPQGVYAGITVTNAGGDGIDINASSATDFVTLRGLSIIGPGAGTSTGNGILFNSGMALHIENCEVRGFNTDIQANLCAKVFITDTVVKDSSNAGIELTMASTGNAWAALDRVTANNCGSYGVLATMSGGSYILNAQIRNSTISGNNTGVAVNATNSAVVTLDVGNCQITNGEVGIQAMASSGGTGTMSIAYSLVSRNSSNGWIVSGGTIDSTGTNTFIGNGPNTGSLTPFTAQ